MFKPAEQCHLFPPGVVDLSPAWFMQGHEVSGFLSCQSLMVLHPPSFQAEAPVTSVGLKKELGAGGHWLAAMGDTLAILKR